MEELKYVWVFLLSEGKMERQIDKWNGAALAMMQTLKRSNVVERELSQLTHLSIYQTIYAPTPIVMISG